MKFGKRLMKERAHHATFAGYYLAYKDLKKSINVLVGDISSSAQLQQVFF